MVTSLVAPASSTSIVDSEKVTLQSVGTEEVRLMFCWSTFPVLVMVRVMEVSRLALASKLSSPLGVERSMV